MGAFDNPAMAAELFAALDTTTGDTRDDAASYQRFPAMRVVVPLVRMHFVRALPWPPGHTRHRWYRVKHCLEHFRVVPVGTCDHECQRNALAVYRDMAFATEFAPVSRVRPSLLTPRGLFTPIQVGNLELVNRIVIAPMAQYLSEGGQINDRHLSHLGRLATSDAAALTIAGTAVTPEGRTSYGDTGLRSAPMA